MLVYVTTPRLIEQAFNHWIAQSPSDERKIVYRVYQEFMESPQAKSFYKVTQLISFAYPQWQSAFDQWRAQEIYTHPANQEKIRYYTERLAALLQSDWALEHKLIVQECLEQALDLVPQPDTDLFDELVLS